MHLAQWQPCYRRLRSPLPRAVSLLPTLCQRRHCRYLGTCSTGPEHYDYWRPEPTSLHQVLCLTKVLFSVFVSSFCPLSRVLLQAQENENRSRTLFQRFECLTDQCARSMKAHPGNIYGYRFHGDAFSLTGDQQIADLNWTTCRINPHSYSASRGD